MEDAKKKKILITINGKVHDVTEFAEEHPGGRYVLDDRNGTDCTEDFNAIGHSEEAKKMLETIALEGGGVGVVADAIVPGGEENLPSKSVNQTEIPLTWEGRFFWFLRRYHWLMYFLTSFIGSILINLLTQNTNFSWVENWNNMNPEYGEAGYGRFDISGYYIKGENESYTITYPWRKVHPDPVGSSIAWLVFLLHLLSHWVILTKALKERMHLKVGRFTSDYNEYNKLMMLSNTVFTLLHVVVSLVYYDGLASSVPEGVALGCVIVMSCIVILLEKPRRGLFYGRMKRWWFMKSDERHHAMNTFVRRYHGYGISAAILLNFHYHPLESTSAHFFGFMYKFLLMWQSSLIYQKDHRNRNWTVVLEIFVVFHAIAAALFQNVNTQVVNFGGGFLFMMLSTQLYGIPVVKAYLFPPILEERTKFRTTAIPALIMAGWFAFVLIITALATGDVTQWYFAIFTPLGIYYVTIALGIFFYLGYTFHERISKRNGYVLLFSGTSWAIGVCVMCAIIGRTFLVPTHQANFRNGTSVTLHEEL